MREARDEMLRTGEDDDEVEFPTPPSTFPELSEDAQKRLSDIEGWLNNTELQRDNNDAACTLLGIEDPQTPRLDGLAPTLVLKFWQPLATAGLVEIEDNPVMEGMNSAMLCDGVGLGKTIEIATLLLYVRTCSPISAGTTA